MDLIFCDAIALGSNQVEVEVPDPKCTWNKRTQSERKTLFFRILLFIDLNIIVYDLTQSLWIWQNKDTQSLVKPYTHFMFIGFTWMHTLNWLLARVVKLLNNFWTGTNILVWQ